MAPPSACNLTVMSAFESKEDRFKNDKNDWHHLKNGAEKSELKLISAFEQSQGKSSIGSELFRPFLTQLGWAGLGSAKTSVTGFHNFYDLAQPAGYGPRRERANTRRKSETLVRIVRRSMLKTTEVSPRILTQTVGPMTIRITAATKPAAPPATTPAVVQLRH